MKKINVLKLTITNNCLKEAQNKMTNECISSIPNFTNHIIWSVFINISFGFVYEKT